MNPKHVRADMARARESLRSAKVLHREGLYADAVSRAYYAVMHSARAALLANDAVAESHAAVRRLFGSVLVQSGKIERHWAQVLAREQTRRIVADYAQEPGVDEESCGSLVEDAERFVERMRKYLRQAGIQLEEQGDDG